MSRPGGAAAGRWGAAALTAGIALVLVIGLGLAFVWRVSSPDGQDSEAAVAPTGAATLPAPPTATGPTPSPTEATPTPEPTAEPTPHATAEPTDPGPEGPPPEGLDAIARQVAALRGLPYEQPLDARVVPPAALGIKYTDLAFEELDADDVAADQRLLTALRLVDSGVDLLAVISDLYQEQVLGLYVPREERLYIGSETVQLSAYKQVTAAHEVVHALQDRAFDIEAMRELPDRDADAALAVIAVLEGDAILAQQEWAARHQTTREREEARREAAGQQSGALGRAPRYLRDSLFFPYTDGAQFVAAVIEQGGWRAVDAVLADPPTSTSAIYHPDRHLAGERPVDVFIGARPGTGWRSDAVYTFGEFDLRQLLLPLGAETSTRVGSGWAGGEVRSFSRDQATAVVLRLAFRNEHAASDACATLPAWYGSVATATVETGAEEGVAQGDGDWMAWRCTRTEVQLALGPDAQTATRLAEAR